LKKTIILSLALVVIITAVFASCTTKTDEDDTSTTEASLDNVGTEIGFETDENGEDVAVVYELDENGKTIAIKLDKDGNKMKNDKGEYVTVKTDYTITTTSSEDNDNKNNDPTKGTEKLTTTTTENPTGTTKKDVPQTSSKDTTKFDGSDNVPKTDATGKEVNFSVADQSILKSMLEVPYLYRSNYENSDGVPIDIACHTAVWMAEHEGNIRSTYPSSPIVLNLFKFYGQTVVNFKTQCNEFAAGTKAPISYNKKNDTFSITEFTEKKQTVSITKIEDLGDNNFYKVTGSVKGCNKKKVVAIVQKNKLDTTLGFSIKALKWS